MIKVKESEKLVYGGCDYDLAGFTEHLGDEATQGHYVAYQEKGRLLFNDHNGVEDPELIRISQAQLAKSRENGYVFLYKRKG